MTAIAARSLAVNILSSAMRRASVASTAIASTSAAPIPDRAFSTSADKPESDCTAGLRQQIAIASPKRKANRTSRSRKRAQRQGASPRSRVRTHWLNIFGLVSGGEDGAREKPRPRP